MQQKRITIIACPTWQTSLYHIFIAFLNAIFYFYGSIVTSPSHTCPRTRFNESSSEKNCAVLYLQSTFILCTSHCPKHCRADSYQRRSDLDCAAPSTTSLKGNPTDFCTIATKGQIRPVPNGERNQPTCAANQPTIPSASTPMRSPYTHASMLADGHVRETRRLREAGEKARVTDAPEKLRFGSNKMSPGLDEVESGVGRSIDNPLAESVPFEAVVVARAGAITFICEQEKHNYAAIIPPSSAHAFLSSHGTGERHPKCIAWSLPSPSPMAPPGSGEPFGAGFGRVEVTVLPFVPRRPEGINKE
ncbi:hypothetical protein ZHAS_00018819 [Anopheles sinensis]|uniref:Uncharacterized protein n=1 Tax=Anopheles sinensis TaxID=74873 RepID=A0A084WKM6_ANOSI|nr:hypothetical protein ZHAS_00018819 [Anopheles sinensis]